MSVAERLGAIRARVAAAATRAGRRPEDVVVVAVAKTFPVEAVSEAVAAGAADIGENRAQELAHKAAVVGDRARWHFVGYLQSNKVRQVVGVAHLIHSVERMGLAEAIARRARATGHEQQVLVEVNLAGEASKHGVEPSQAISLARGVNALEGVAVRGLMAIPPAVADPEHTRPYFRELAALGGALTAVIPGATHLSMGMSRDFEVAIEEGATIVRIGEGIFGSRVSR